MTIDKAVKSSWKKSGQYIGSIMAMCRRRMNCYFGL